jgi:hypothetical protein
MAGLAHIVRQQPYEGALAFALGLQAAWSLTQPPREAGALGRLLDRWQLDVADGALIVGAVLTLAGLAAVAVVTGAVHRVLARRVEQAGQLLIAGVLVAVATAAFSLGHVGVVGGLVYGSLAFAAGLRAVLVGRLVRGQGFERTEVAG